MVVYAGGVELPVRLVLDDGRAGGQRPLDAHLLHVVRERVQQTHDLLRRRVAGDARDEDAAVVDRVAHACNQQLYSYSLVVLNLGQYSEIHNSNPISVTTRVSNKKVCP